MTISMSSASLPIFTSVLSNLKHCLGKAQAYADAKNFDSTNLVQARLAPNMFALARQVQIACDSVKNGSARLAGVEAPKFEDDETTLVQLQERIQKTIDWLATVSVDKINGTEEKEITFPAGPNKTLTMTGLAYLTRWVTPNFYFHVTTAYAILRHNGVDLGKTDYLTGAGSL